MKARKMGKKAHSINEDRDCVVWEALGRIWDGVYGVTVRYEKEKKEKFLNAAIYGQSPVPFLLGESSELSL